MTLFKRRSLTLQLLAGIGVPFLIVIALIGGIAYLSALDEISEVYDSQMITSAQQLAIIAQSDDDAADVLVGRVDPHLNAGDQHALDDYARWRIFRVWRDGKLVLGSDGGPVMPAASPKGFSTVHTPKGQWRVFTFVVPERRLTVVIGESLRARSVVSRRVVWGVCLPLLLVLPVIVLMVWLGIRFGLKDLRRFAGDIGQRSSDDLSHVGNEALPIELAPVASSVNQLLDKLKRSLAQERLFTDNAAHELRTPLAALVVQTDVLRNAQSDAERRSMLEELSQGVSRASRLLDQLLVLARIRHTPVQPTPLNLYDAASDTIREFYPRAQARDIEFSLSGDEAVTVASNRPLLALLVGNVVDNAIKYSPPGSAVELSVTQHSGQPLLIVRDHGPGIPESERTQVFARFYRLKGRAESGSGLGLAIVQTLGELLGADISLFTPDDGKGLGVRVAFRP